MMNHYLFVYAPIFHTFIFIFSKDSLVTCLKSQTICDNDMVSLILIKRERILLILQNKIGLHNFLTCGRNLLNSSNHYSINFAFNNRPHASCRLDMEEVSLIT